MNYCIPFWRSSLRTCISTKSSIRLGSRPRVVSYKKKKYCKLNIFINNKKLIKINLTICFACETKGTLPPVCLVTEPWICRLRFPVSDCKRRVKRSDITYWIYSAHVSSGMYSGLKSFQTVTSFQPGKAFSLAYF
jgi:hypothetical protein